MRIAVTPVAGPVVRALVPRLAGDDLVDEVLLVGTGAASLLAELGSPVGVRAVEADLRTADVVAALGGVDCVVHLGLTAPVGPTGPDRAALAALHRLLDGIGRGAAGALVHVSSATVYGAWPANPVPLSEEAPLRPNPGFAPAAQHAEGERLVAALAAEHPQLRCVVLRPAVVLAAGEESWLTKALGGARGLQVGTEAPPLQLLHPDDLASAIHLAATTPRISGVRNVAPDLGISGDEAAELAAGPPRFTLPARLAPVVAGVAWAAGLGRRPPSSLPYRTHPWVVAPDLLKADGWVPSWSSAEVLVGARPGSTWRELGPSRRQAVALGGAAAAVAAAVGGVVAWVARGRRRAAG